MKNTMAKYCMRVIAVTSKTSAKTTRNSPTTKTIHDHTQTTIQP